MVTHTQAKRMMWFADQFDAHMTRVAELCEELKTILHDKSLVRKLAISEELDVLYVQIRNLAERAENPSMTKSAERAIADVQTLTKLFLVQNGLEKPDAGSELQ